MEPTSRNVTINPLSKATPVDHPEIAEVTDLLSGDILNVRDFIASHRYDRLIQLRNSLREGLKRKSPHLKCSVCGTPVYLVANTHKRFFFRHAREDGSCPAVTREKLTNEEIRARKYHGLRESDAHKRIKRLIERSLRADPAFEAESIRCEARWKTAHDSGNWRQPDVQARSAGARYAFEAQLSTTFLDVVVQRRLFYHDEGAILVWVLGHFDPTNRRMTEDDLLFSNNSNAFVIDAETTAISEELQRFYLRCYFRRPLFNDEKIDNQWETAIVPFSDLSVDEKHGTIFYFDYNAEEERLQGPTNNALREKFVLFWKRTMVPHFAGSADDLNHWSQLREDFTARGIALPHYPGDDASLRSLILAVLSAQAGRPVGWKFERLIQVAHLLAESHPENLLVFALAVDRFDRKALLEQQDRSGRWKSRRTTLWQRIKKRESCYIPNPQWRPALRFIFPAVGASVDNFLSVTPRRKR